jgi:hypothetical protein
MAKHDARCCWRLQQRYDGDALCCYGERQWGQPYAAQLLLVAEANLLPVTEFSAVFGGSMSGAIDRETVVERPTAPKNIRIKKNRYAGPSW